LNYAISIDCGSTFTDGYLTLGSEEQIRAKVLTTPYDLTVCFRNLLGELATQLGISVDELLANAAGLRFSTTSGNNTILQRSGPRLGLVLTQGSKKRYLKESHAAKEGFIRKEMIEEIPEEVDSSGQVRRAPSEEQMLKAVERLLDSGARCIVVGFTNAALNPANEQAFRACVEQNYPQHLLGAVPVLLSSEISKRPHDIVRINTALLNAYLHRDMARLLYSVQSYVKGHGYPKNLLVGHGSGGVARLATTIAVATYNSGPAAVVTGAGRVAPLYGMDRLITADMGGTSLDAAALEGGSPKFINQADINGLQCYTLTPMIASLGVGGSSVAGVKKTGLDVGPRSAGSLPGPACFNRGGKEPTVTDADLVLGMINAERFLGGRIKLSLKAATQSIKKYIAAPLGVSVEEAAWRIKNTADGKIAALLKEILGQKGWSAGEVTILAAGGAGPAHCCSFAEMAGIGKILICRHSPVFGAFGLAGASITHFGEVSRANGEYTGALQQAKAKAACDMETEGFKGEGVVYHLWPVGKKHGFTGKKQLEDQICLSEDVEALLLQASVEAPPWSPAIYPDAGEEQSQAISSWRPVYWGGGYSGTPVFKRELLKTGNKVKGPAIVEDNDTTYVIPPGWHLLIDKYQNALIAKEA